MILTCGRSVLPISGRPRTTTLLRLVGLVELRQRVQHHHFLRDERLAVGAARHLGRGLDQRGLVAEHAALHLGLAALADHDDVVG